MSLGEAYVTIKADTSELQADLEAKLRPILDAAKASINITANLDRFTQSVNDAAAAASRLTAQINVGANTGEATRQTEDLVSAIEQAVAVLTVDSNISAAVTKVDFLRTLADTPASFRVSVDTGDAEARIVALRAEIAALGTSTAPRVLATGGLTASQTRGAVDLSSLGLADTTAAAEDATAALGDTASAADKVGSATAKAKDAADGFGLSLRSLLPLAIGVGVALAPLAISFAAAAAGAFEGIRQADAIRSATLEFQSYGDSAGYAALKVQQLITISNEGAGGLTVLSAASNSLSSITKDTTSAVQALSDVLAHQGLVGGALATQITASSAAISQLAGNTDITTKSLKSSIDSLGLGVSQAQVFKALETELGKTQAQIDKILSTTGLTGAAVAAAALAAAAAQPGVSGATVAATQSSPTAAIASLKDSLASALGDAFTQSNPAIAKGIDSLRDQLVKSISAAGPDLTAFATSALHALQVALPPIVAGIQDLLPQVLKITDALTAFVQNAIDPNSSVHHFFVDLKNDIVAIGQVAIPIIKGLVVGVAAIIEGLSPLITLLGDIASTQAGKVLLEIAGAIGAVVLAAKAFGAVTTAIKAVSDAAIVAAAKIGLVETAEEGAAGAAAVGKWVGLSGVIESLAGSLGGVALAGAAAGAGLALALNAVTPKGFSNKDELPTATYTAGIQALQSEINKFSDANLRQQLTNIVQSSLAANDGQDKFSGAIVAAQKAVTDFSTAHGVQQSQALATALAALPKETNLSVDVDTTQGIANLRALALAGVAAANAVLLAQENSAAANAAFQQGPDSTAGGLPIDQAGFSATSGATAINASDFSGGGTGTGTGTGTGGASAAATKLTDAKNAIASALTSLVDTIGGANTVAAVDAAFKSLQDVLDKNEKILGQKEPAGLKAYIAKEKTALEDLARQQELIASAISAAASQTSSALSFADTVTASATTGVADLSKLTLITTGATAAATAAAKLGLVFTSVNQSAITAAKTGKAASEALSAVATASPSDNGFLAGLQTKLQQLQQFAADINAAQKAGLDPALVQQFLSAGPASDPQLKSILASGTANIAAINSTQKAITAAANALGDEAAKSTLAAGVAVADGFIQGLEAQSDKLTAAATKLGNLIAAAVKKALGIKSPSVVMRALGVHAGTGLHLGLADTLPHIQAAAERMAKAAQPVMGATALERARGMELHGVAAPSVTNHRVTINSPVSFTGPVTNGTATGSLHAAQLSRLSR